MTMLINQDSLRQRFAMVVAGAANSSSVGQKLADEIVESLPLGIGTDRDRVEVLQALATTLSTAASGLARRIPDGPAMILPAFMDGVHRTRIVDESGLPLQMNEDVRQGHIVEVINAVTEELEARGELISPVNSGGLARVQIRLPNGQLLLTEGFVDRA